MDELEKIRKDALSDPMYFTKKLEEATALGTTLFASCVDCGRFLADIEQRDDTRCDACEKVKCLDCGIHYGELGLDLVLPDEQWLMIHPEGLGGILCANCIMKRAEKLNGSTVVLAEIDV